MCLMRGVLILDSVENTQTMSGRLFVALVLAVLASCLGAEAKTKVHRIAMRKMGKLSEMRRSHLKSTGVDTDGETV